ncbi:unnamed protein product [Cladocopium goreaui]|uniref:ER membrane protein complex subunit 2 n=1 Tax=Cladocopium goreaui TaxID=2562237 RepID=A0A9P1BN46_9DINO|nr:unnamed protein product [Cladocopium goreaui]
MTMLNPAMASLSTFLGRPNSRAFEARPLIGRAPAPWILRARRDEAPSLLCRAAAAAATVAAVATAKTSRTSKLGWKKKKADPWERKKQFDKENAQWPTKESLLDFLNSKKAAAHPGQWARAVRHCGRRGWWEVLHEAPQARPSTCFQVSTVATALVDCIGKAPKVLQAERKDKALTLLGALWRDMELEKATNEDQLYALSSSLNLCVLLGTDRALAWADQLWEWSEEETDTSKNEVVWSTYLQLQETQGRFDTVNDVLMRVFVERKIKANSQMLTALLELAAQRRDWKRAEDLWHILVDSLHVEPNLLARGAFAKAYFMAGRLTSAEELLAGEADKMSYRLGNDYLQILLILCHSSPTKSNLEKLKEFVERNRTVKRYGGAEGEWRRMTDLVLRLTKEVGAPLRLREVLVTRKARCSAMMRWTDQPMGACYAK